MSRVPRDLQEKTELALSQGLHVLLDTLVQLERGLLVLLQMSQDLQDLEVKRGMKTQVPQVDLERPGFKDGMALQVLQEQPVLFRLQWAQQGW